MVVGFPRAIEMVVEKLVVVGTNSGQVCLFGWEERGVEVLGGPAE